MPDSTEPTPRPWSFESDIEGIHLIGPDDDHEHPAFSTVSEVWTSRDWADAALIVEAVNDYDRLKRIEQAARDLVRDWGTIGPMMADLRTTLEEK